MDVRCSILKLVVFLQPVVNAAQWGDNDWDGDIAGRSFKFFFTSRGTGSPSTNFMRIVSTRCSQSRRLFTNLGTYYWKYDMTGSIRIKFSPNAISFSF